VMQEVRRIKSQHLNDRNAIVNRRVKGKLSVTRAFGVGYLKQVLPCFANYCHFLFTFDHLFYLKYKFTYVQL
jgi:hypothetical protein